MQGSVFDGVWKPAAEFQQAVRESSKRTAIEWWSVSGCQAVTIDATIFDEQVVPRCFDGQRNRPSARVFAALMTGLTRHEPRGINPIDLAEAVLVDEFVVRLVLTRMREARLLLCEGHGSRPGFGGDRYGWRLSPSLFLDLSGRKVILEPFEPPHRPGQIEIHARAA